MTPSRRTVLKWMGLQLALPLVGNAQGAPTRKRFIGAYVPNGAYMPMGVDGSWTFADALQPRATATADGRCNCRNKAHEPQPFARTAPARRNGQLNGMHGPASPNGALNRSLRLAST